MADVVIDTDVASVLQKGRAPAWVTRRVAGQRVWLTFVTVGELWKWAEDFEDFARHEGLILLGE